MKNDLFSGRLHQLRVALVRGPIGTLTDLAERANVAEYLLQSGYRSKIQPKTRQRIALAAAEVIEADPDAMQRWLVDGETEPAVQDLVEWLPTQSRCTLCGGFFDKTDTERYTPAKRRCRKCVRHKNNPRSARYENLLREGLPQIGAISEALAAAVRDTLDEARTPTYERLAQRAGLPLKEVTQTLRRLGLTRVIGTASAPRAEKAVKAGEEALFRRTRCRLRNDIGVARVAA